jgi:hypothetical protein
VQSKPDGILYCAKSALIIPDPSPELYRTNEFLLFLSAFGWFVKPAPYFSIIESETALPGAVILLHVHNTADAA